MDGLLFDTPAIDLITYSDDIGPTYYWLEDEQYEQERELGNLYRSF